MGRAVLRLLCLALLVVATAQRPSDVEGEAIAILPIDPCELLSNRQTGGKGIDPGTLRTLAQGCLSRAKRSAIDPSGYTPERPDGRDTRGLFIKASKAHGGLIYPGTKWCGPGDVARNYWDLGRLADEDRCCRMHDNCPESITAGSCRHGICNSTPFTRSHCACDESFRRCLQALRSPAADNIGALYFNVGNVLCFAEDEEDNELPGNVLEDRYGVDLDAPEQWSRGRSNSDALSGGGQRIGCSTRANCAYKFHTQKHYTEAAARNKGIATALQRPRTYQPELTSPQANTVTTDKRSAADHRAAQLLSKFFHHFLLSTGILRPRI